MARERILVGQDEAIVEAARPLMARIDADIELVAVGDGARCIVAFTKLIRAGKPPLLVVLDDDLARVDGEGCARALRAIERAFESDPVAILFYADEAADEPRKGLLATLGRAVHLQRRPEPTDARALRLAKAIAKLLKQVRGQ